MTRDDIRARDAARLATVSEFLRIRVGLILAAMETLGFDMFVASAARTAEEQFALYKKGRVLRNGLWIPEHPNRKGIVTNADGFKKLSNHQTKEDGLGRAVDLVFLVDGPDHDNELDTPSWDESHPWDLMGLMAEKQGLVWGGRWNTMRDMPHVEQRPGE